jgi:spoIIIJ-associated protein
MTLQEYLDEVFSYLTVKPESINIREDNEDYIFIDMTVSEDDAGKMIGKYGDTIISLSHLVTTTFREQLEGKKVVFDVNGYKDRREEEAREIGLEAAERAVESQRPQHLPRSWQSHQRRAVHQALQDFVGVTTQSEGEGSERHLVVYPAALAPEKVEDAQE